MSTTTLIPSPRDITTEPRLSDKVFRGVVSAGGFSSLAILGLIAIFLAYRGFEVLKEEGLGFITNAEWTITQDESANVVESHFGLAAMLVGTILCALVAVIIAVPISVFSALYLNFYAPNWL
jgi:phosphate transport system permease protein